MIVKKVKNELQNPKPKAWQIKDLVDYIRYPHNVNPEEKIEYSGSRNFLSETHVGQRAEMIALANETVHSKMPVQHWIFSWKEGEQPTNAQVEEFVDIFLEKMELQGHQAVFGLHNNTDNLHLHIAVNRVNPISMKVVQPHKGFDLEAAHRIVAYAENKQGWESEKNARYIVLENGEIAKKRRQPEIKPNRAALDFEHAKGEKSAQRIAQERGYEIIKNALTWEELHAKLAQINLRFEKKGSGAIIFVGDIAIKASSVDRKFSMKKLIARLGEFRPGIYSDHLLLIPPESVSNVNLPEWHEYQNEKKQILRIKKETNSIISSLRGEHKNIRRKVVLNLAKHGLPILNIARHFLGKQQHSELIDLQNKIRKSQKMRGIPRFEEWLRRQGKHKKADLWRYRKSFEPDIKKHSQEVGQMININLQLQNFVTYDKAIGADTYRVTCIKMSDNGDKKTFILDKEKGITKGFSANEIEKRIPEMLRLQAREENIYYTPLSRKNHYVLVDDMDKKKLDELIRDGFHPAILLESSPENFQCILVVPKLGTEFDQDTGNRLTERLNRKYGDPKLSGCIHPHRAPGFENRKPKHRRDDGSYPVVSIVWSKAQMCSTALELSRQINAEYVQAAVVRKQRQADALLMQKTRPGDPISAYKAHLDNIRKHLTIEDASRVDSMIALRMRSNGHDQKSITEAIRLCAPAMRGSDEQRRDWQRYAERTAAYAFGIAGDRDLERNAKYADLWRRIEGLDSQQEKNRQRQKMK